MKVVGMSELDLNGIFVTEFPDTLSLEECRERLELLIYEFRELTYEGWEEDLKPDLVISPYTVYTALWLKRDKEFSRMTDDEKKRAIEEAWEMRRRARMDAAKVATDEAVTEG